MFRRLKKKIIISNMIFFGVLVLGLLGTIYGLSYARMSTQIDESLQNAIMSARNSSFLLPGTLENSRKEPNSLIIFIDLTENSITYLSDYSYYDEQNLVEIVDNVVDQSKHQGKLKIKDHNIAYNIYSVDNIARIVIYDYTLLQNNLNSLMFILIGAFIISFVSLFFIFRMYAQKTIKPIEEAFYKQKELIANASHELKTPLTIISTSLSVINTSQKDNVENQRKWLDNISLQTQRMSNLINDMLELARVDNLNEQRILSYVNVSQLLQRVLLGMEAVFFESGLIIETDIAENLKVKGDTESIEKLFYILIDNAVKYTQRNGTISVSLKNDKKRTVFKIRNSGEGIPKEKIPKLFDRFYRADEARTQGKAQSFGLGLSIAKSIVDSLDADIDVDIEEDNHTVFTVTFR